MLENILRTKCMGLGSINLQMGIVMREPGMRVEGKASVCTRLEMGRLKLVTGKMESLMFQAHRMQLILYLLLLLIIPKCLMQFRYLIVVRSLLILYGKVILVDAFTIKSSIKRLNVE